MTQFSASSQGKLQRKMPAARSSPFQNPHFYSVFGGFEKTGTVIASLPSVMPGV